MEEPKLHIRNMVCNRCIMVVKSTLSEFNIEPKHIELGVVHLHTKLPDEVAQKLMNALHEKGFEVVGDKTAQLVDKIRTELIRLVQTETLHTLKVNLSAYLANFVGKDYSAISQLFSQMENITIEKFVILQKIEKAKELLVYDEETLSEISFRLGYSSVAHLSAQFKQITGFTPSEFRKLKSHQRKALDQL